jgi:hypothetical protein
MYYFSHVCYGFPHNIALIPIGIGTVLILDFIKLDMYSLGAKISGFFQIAKNINLYMFFYQLYKSFFEHNFIFF